MCFCTSAYALTATPTITRTISPTITPTYTATPHPLVDPNHVYMNTKPIAVETVGAIFAEVMPVGLSPLIDGYDTIYLNVINPRLSGNCTLRLHVRISNIATVRAYLVANSIDAGTVTATAYNGISQ